MGNLSKRSLGSFLVVGGSATLLHYAIMAALMTAGVTKGYASAIGYSLSTLYNYWANARYTFLGAHQHRRSLPRFLITAIAGLGINQIVLLSLARLGLHIGLSQLCATACVFVWNYLINACWSFSQRQSS
jgi:putative flippase GtrA